MKMVLWRMTETSHFELCFEHAISEYPYVSIETSGKLGLNFQFLVRTKVYEL